MEQLTISQEGYIELKQKIKKKLNEAVNNFIIIGFYLKQVRDSMAYREDGYKSLEEFAQCEYRLSASTTSRFMDINTEFSRGGNSLEIKDEYRNYAYSKLQEMLTVRPEDRELITEATTVKQIRELKAAEKEEEKAAEEDRQKEVPLLQMAAPENDMPEADKDTAAAPAEPFAAVMTAFWTENPEIYTKAAAGMLTPEIAAEEICPSGSRTYRNGTSMVFFYDFDKGIKLRSIENGKPLITPYTYQALLDKTRELDIRLPHEEPEIEREEPERTQEEPEKKQQEEALATSQSGQNEAYVPLPGQTSVADLRDVVPKEDKAIAAAGEDREKETAMQTENIIAADYRELAEQGTDTNTEETEQQPGEFMFSDIEIKNAAGFFETEYARMTMEGQDTAKRKYYKIAMESIRWCFPLLSGR